jgi:hypothetical protein
MDTMGRGNYYHKNGCFIYLPFPDYETQKQFHDSEEMGYEFDYSECVGADHEQVQYLVSEAKPTYNFPVHVLQDESYFVLQMEASENFQREYPGLVERSLVWNWGGFLKRLLKVAPNLEIRFRTSAWTSGRCTLAEYVATNYPRKGRA